MSGFQLEKEQCDKIAPPSSLLSRNNVKSICRGSLLVVLRFDKIFLWRFPFSFFAPHQAKHAILAFAANWPLGHLEI